MFYAISELHFSIKLISYVVCMLPFIYDYETQLISHTQNSFKFQFGRQLQPSTVFQHSMSRAAEAMSSVRKKITTTTTNNDSYSLGIYPNCYAITGGSSQ
jgi:hypothetical protein